MDPASRLRTAYRALLLLGVVCVGLAGACVILWNRGAEASPVTELDDPRVREAAIAKLVAAGAGGWDTFPDPEVGRVLQPDLRDRNMSGVGLASDELGLREGPVARPKPAGTTRVVLLGDSFVMGEGVEAGDRLGVFLAKDLRERAGAAAGPIECLHFGLDSWNIVAEAAFLRRQLSLVQPDLVVHVIIRNDLEDNPGARGFGGMSSFDPLHAERGDGLFQVRFPTLAFRTREYNWIAHGLDQESRARFEDAGRRVADLARRVEARGGRYLLVDNYSGLLPASRRFIASKLPPGQVCYLPTAPQRDDRWRISKDNAHWNRAGHELVASILYSVIRARRLLPALTLAEWPQADATAKDWLEQGEAEAGAEPRLDRLPPRRSIRSAIDFHDLDDDAAAQVTGGVLAGGRVGPYAALILKGGSARKLAIDGAALLRPEIDGATVAVFVEEAQVGSFTLKAGAPIALRFDVPADLGARPFLAVRFRSDDYAYSEENPRQFVVFRLDRIALTDS